MDNENIVEYYFHWCVILILLVLLALSIILLKHHRSTKTLEVSDYSNKLEIILPYYY